MAGSAARLESPARRGAGPPPPEARILSGEALPPPLTPGDPARSAPPPPRGNRFRPCAPTARRTARVPPPNGPFPGRQCLSERTRSTTFRAFAQEHRCLRRPPWQRRARQPNQLHPQSRGADPRQGHRRSRGRRPRDRGHRGGKTRRDQEVLRERILVPEGRRTENGRPRGRGSAFEVRDRNEEAGRCRKRPIDGEGLDRRSLEGSDRGRPRFEAGDEGDRPRASPARGTSGRSCRSGRSGRSRRSCRSRPSCRSRRSCRSRPSPGTA